MTIQLFFRSPFTKAHDPPSLTQEEYTSDILKLFKANYESKLFHYLLTLPNLIECGLVSENAGLKPKKLYVIPLLPAERKVAPKAELAADGDNGL